VPGGPVFFQSIEEICGAIDACGFDGCGSDPDRAGIWSGELASDEDVPRWTGTAGGIMSPWIPMGADHDGRCTLSIVGHPAPFLNEVELTLPAALPLGLDIAGSYEETSFYLSPGDRLALYTDGILEACGETGELYGFDRLTALFATRPSAQQAMETAVAFGQDDDITVLTLTRLAAGEESTAVSIAPVLIDG
jgi:hypothetical protein